MLFLERFLLPKPLVFAALRFTLGLTPKSNTSANSCPRLPTAGRHVIQNFVRNKKHRQECRCHTSLVNPKRSNPHNGAPNARRFSRVGADGQRPVFSHRTRPNRSRPAMEAGKPWLYPKLPAPNPQ